MKLDCSKCISAEVCKYKDEFLEAVQNIENDIAPYEDLVAVSISCKYLKWDNMISTFVPREVSNE